MLEITDFYVGQSVEFSHQILQEDIDRFVELTGDDNPMHIDSDFTSKTEIKYPVVHGMLTASFISTVIGKHLPGAGALWVSQKIEFLSPVRVGDRVSIFAEIKKVNVAHRLLTLSINIRNQLNRSVIRGESIVRWPKKLHVEQNCHLVNKERKVALITGASRGIGAEIALQLGKAGFFVYVNYYRSLKSASEVLNLIKEAGGDGVILRGNVFDVCDVRNIFMEIKMRHEKLDLLVNNASPSIYEADLSELSWDQFSEQFIPHVKTLFLCLKEALPFLEKSCCASVVNIGSVVVDDPPVKWLGYNLGKGAVHTLTKSLSKTLGTKGIRINTVAPGFTDTDLIIDVPERQLMMLKMNTPLGKLGTTREVAQAVLFLAGENSSHITGQILKVNGGIA